jgi:hypothetical protein
MLDVLDKSHFRKILQVTKKNGSPGRTRTCNISVNSH